MNLFSAFCSLTGFSYGLTIFKYHQNHQTVNRWRFPVIVYNNHTLVSQNDHYESLGFIIESAKAKQKIDNKFIQNINAHVMKSTGTVHNTALGAFDSSKGDLRLLNVRAGMSGESYMNYNKVPQYLKNMCTDLSSKINEVKTVEEINELAFLAHYQLVTIHPFVDGNGRTSRLLMNYIQSYHTMPMTIVFEEDRQEYI